MLLLLFLLLIFLGVLTLLVLILLLVLVLLLVRLVLLRLLLLLLEFFQPLFYEFIIELRIGILRIELHRTFVILERFLPRLGALSRVRIVLAQMIERVAAIIVSQFLQVEIG